MMENCKKNNGDVSAGAPWFNECLSRRGICKFTLRIDELKEISPINAITYENTRFRKCIVLHV